MYRPKPVLCTSDDAALRQACQQSWLRIEDGVGRGELYSVDFATKRIIQVRKWTNIQFGQVSGGTTPIRVNVDIKSSVIRKVPGYASPQITRDGGQMESTVYESTARVGIRNNRVWSLLWTNNDGLSINFQAVDIEGKTAVERQSDETTLALARLNQEDEQLVTNCIRVRPSASGNARLDRDFVNSCSFPVVVRYCFTDIRERNTIYDCPNGRLVSAVNRTYSGTSTTTDDNVLQAVVRPNGRTQMSAILANPQGMIPVGQITYSDQNRTRPVRFLAHRCSYVRRNHCGSIGIEYGFE